MLTKIVERLNQAVPGSVLEQEAVDEDNRLTIARDDIKKVYRTLKRDPDFNFKLLVDLSCVDYLGEDERFEVIYQLHSLTANERLRLKVRVPEGERIDTVSGVWAVADPLEREVWDMFGVEFEGHPNLTRLLMYDEFKGHPLRKDYPLKGHQPIIKLRMPIETKDDPPYFWDTFQERRKQDLDD